MTAPLGPIPTASLNASANMDKLHNPVSSCPCVKWSLLITHTLNSCSEVYRD